MKISKFQVIVLGLFLVFLIAGVAMFATYKGGNQQASLPNVIIWGTFPKDKFDSYVSKVNLTLQSQVSVSYTEFQPENFLGSFIAALARGNGPDAILVTADMILPSQDKLITIPYASYPQRSFIDQFIDEARVYLYSDGIIGVPFVVDPLVMYWNRDMFNVAGIAKPPVYWDDFKNIIKRVSERDTNGNIIKSAVAMGDFSNVTNAREILGSILLQAGNPVTKHDATGLVESTLNPNYTANPVPAVTYFTQFVDPANENYSWNRSWPESKNAFISGKLATYFGFASELYALRNKNPNLNYDVAAFPQDKDAVQVATYGKLYGFSITKQSRIQTGAFQVVSMLASPQYISIISDEMYLPSVSRAVIAQGTKDEYLSVFNKQALISKTWLDADPAKSKQVFGGMVQAITSGQKSIYQALTDAAGQHNVILRQALGY